MEKVAGSLALDKNEIMVILAKRDMASIIPLHLLNDREMARYQAFVFVADRQRYLVAHGLKRQVLAQLTGKSPAALQFHAGPAGKPYLADVNLHFNLSHSGDWIALAFCVRHPLGIDVEQPRNICYDSLWKQIAHPQDQISLQEYTEEKTEEQGFLATWSMKEAVAKCTGLGLSMDFPSLRLTPDGSGKHVCVNRDGAWYIRHFIHEDMHMAVASSDADLRLRLVQLT
ncbi:4'-phosphopantetheinyl transferase family protein [Undibacterium hunanense]|uniref:4'-phosphopantetheinyl transferase family protein n=1 Tax=Undibacterium hunanense TaxID=2762292 RepID=UPI001E2B8348|nr:4'-phosphopantetheinyl transferase superfamily protein [Undibacterium hunanense]